MLQWLRESFHRFSWTLWLVIIAFVVGFVVVGNSGDQRVSPGYVARIGDRSISDAEFNRGYRNLYEQYRQIYGENFNDELVRQAQLHLRVVEQLVGSKILASEAQKLGLKVSDEELKQHIFDLGFKDESGRFVGAKRYEDMLRRGGYPTPAVFEDSLRESLLTDKLRQAMSAGVYVPDSAVEAAYRDDVERVKVRYVNLPASRFAAEATVSAEELKPYFEARREEYRKPEQRVATYVLVDNNLLRSTIEVPEADLRAYYDSHSDEFKLEEQVRARHILVKIDDVKTEAAALAGIEAARRRVNAGEDFAAVAREVSEDEGSKARGGDLSYFGRGQMVPEFEQAAFAAAPGSVVGPVKSSFGYHLIKVEDHRPGGSRPFDEAKSSIRLRLQSEKVQVESERRAKALYDRIQAEKRTTVEKLKELTQEGAFVVVETSPPFGQSESVGALGRVPAFNEQAFAMKVNELSKPVKVPRGWAILRLDEVRPPRLPELSEVEAQVRRKLEQTRQQERAMARLQAAKAEIAAGKTLDEVAASLGIEARDSNEFGRQQPIEGLGTNPALAEAALALAPGAVGGPVAARQGAVLFQVVERKAWNPAEFAKNKEQTRERLESEELNRVMGALIERRRNELGLDYSDAFLQRFDIAEPSGS